MTPWTLLPIAEEKITESCRYSHIRSLALAGPTPGQDSPPGSTATGRTGFSASTTLPELVPNA